MRIPLLELPPNRVRRNYRGGATLDALESAPAPRDGDRPEDWIASTVLATNPGLPPIAGEGLAHAVIEGRRVHLKDLFAADPHYYLGAKHVAQCGTQLGFLVKLLDSSIRLHTQAHPTAAFAQKHLGSRWGKLETYVILAVRPGVEPYIRLGFQRPPSPNEWRRIVLEQDIAAMDACFDRIPVRVGEVWLVPGGLPHAIGEGVLMLEVMEPTDLVVRCEFEREGIVVPPEARFMQRDPDFALRIFDYTPLTAEEVRRRFRIPPQSAAQRDGLVEERLIGPEHTECFRVERMTVSASADVPMTGRVRVGVVAAGRGTASGGDRQAPLRPGTRLLVAASAPSVRLTCDGPEPLQVLWCLPGID